MYQDTIISETNDFLELECILNASVEQTSIGKYIQPSWTFIDVIAICWSECCPPNSSCQLANYQDLYIRPAWGPPESNRMNFSDMVFTCTTVTVYSWWH